MMTQNRIGIDPISAQSLYLEPTVNHQPLGSATGFVVQQNDRKYLITNWHVVSGRHPDTNQICSPTAAVPDGIKIAYHTHKLGTWISRVEQLQDEQGNSRWIEHPNGHQIDVVALPLQAVDDQVIVYEFDLSLADTDMMAEVAMPVSIIGFPLGLAAAGTFPIWKTGHIASDPDLDYRGLPAFLIDATTRCGMSGSPVILRLYGVYTARSSKTQITRDRRKTRFLGVYSGRIHADSDIGMVWRPHVITEILNCV